MAERIRSRRVLLQDGDNLVTAAAELTLEQGRIVRVERGERSPELEGEPVHDFGDHLITPAFVNAHTHLALAFLRGIDPAAFQRNLVEELYFHFESRLTPDDVRAFTRMGAYESLLSGVGCVWDHYYGEQALAEALLDTGLTGVVAPTLQDLAGPGVGGVERALEASIAIAEGERYRHAGVFAALGPHATDTVSPALLRTVAELSERHGLPVHMHLAQSNDELVRVEAREGRGPLEVLAREGLLTRAPSLVLAHAMYVPTASLRQLDASRHTLVFCPSSQLQFGFPAHVAHWNELGLSWVVATDCASSNDSMNLQKELRWCHGAASATVTGSAEYAAFLALGGSAEAADVYRLRSARVAQDAVNVRSASLLRRVLTLPGSLHPAFRAGVIAPGALANLIVWNTDHPAFWPDRDPLRALALSDTLQAMHALYVNGKTIGRIGGVVDGVLGSAAYQEARREATERLAHLLDG